MKILLSVVFILSLISTALAGVRIEAHNDHSHEVTSSHQHHGHSHTHTHKTPTKKTDSKHDCSHVHIHLNAICFGLLISSNDFLIAPSSSEKLLSYGEQQMISQEFVKSLYRPPIV